MNKNKYNFKESVLFLLKFFITFFVLHTIILNLNLDFFNSFLAFISASYLGLDFISNIILVNNMSFVITNSCTGLVSSAILVAINFASKRPFEFKKIKVVVFGVLVLLIINVPRIMFILISAKIGLDPNFIHSLTWFLMSGLVLILWYYLDF